MGGYEAKALPALRYFVEHDGWPKLRKVPGGKYEAAGPGGRPPRFPAAERDERGTGNHRAQSGAVAHLAHPRMKAGVNVVLGDFREQLVSGHMTVECMSPSHCDEWYAPVAALAMRSPNAEVRDEAVAWFARELALCLRFYEPGIRRGSVIAPGSRAWGGGKGGEQVKQGWKSGSVPSEQQHSNIRDEGIVRWGYFRRPPKGAYVGPDANVMALLTHPDMPWDAICSAAEKVDVAKVRLVAPIHEESIPDGRVVRWWWPPSSVTRTRPTVYVATVHDGRDDSYICYADEARQWIGKRPSESQIGVAA